MGTYLQGVQSIIPSLQPSDTGLNVVANLLQLKQSQYDSNYKSLNKLYGQYYYADLTRKDNIEKRDNTVKQIDFDLKRISGLDLSLEQNVNQAMQVFKPFYEDTALMKDMAWTKNFNNTLGSAEGLNKSTDLKQKEQYWGEGIQALQYKRKEFMEASADEAMSFENPIYTPYVNVQKKSAEIFKDSGISIEKTTPNGGYLVRQKNGELIMEPLNHLLHSQLSADPMVKAVYDTKAYVQRKNWANQHADEYGGAKQAEMKYLDDGFKELKDITANNHANLQERSKVYDTKIADIENQIKENGSNPLLEKKLKEYREGKTTNDNILGSYAEQLEFFNDAYSSSGNTSTGSKNPYSDINSLRRIVDSSMSNTLFAEDIDTATEDLSKRDMEIEYKADPFALIAKRHSTRMAEIKQQAYYNKYDYDGELKPKTRTGGKKDDENEKNTETPVWKDDDAKKDDKAPEW